MGEGSRIADFQENAMMPSAEELARLVNATARLWDFSCSHDMLVVRVERADSTVAFLVLSGCESINAPTFWRMSTPAFQPAGEPYIEFTDVDVRIKCQDASIHTEFRTR